MHALTDLDAFRDTLADVVQHGDAACIAALIYPAGRALAAEHGTAFRELVGALPADIWHSDPRIAAQLGESYRATGSPRGQAALGYFRAAEDALGLTPEAPIHCLASVLLGHAAGLRTMGLVDQARAKATAAHQIISTRLADVPKIRVELGARYSLEYGMLELDAGNFDSARSHLEYAHGLATIHLSRAEHVELLGALAKVDATDGFLDRATEQVERAKALAAGTDLLKTGYGAPALIAEVWVASERLDLAAAAATEAAMLEAARGNEWEPHALVASAQTAALSGRKIEALDLVEQALQAYNGWELRGFAANFAQLVRAALLLSLDHADKSWAILQTLEPGERHMLCPARITAQLRMAHGDLLGAEAAIRECEALGEVHCSRTVADIQLIRADIESARGKLRASDVSADRALQTMARTGCRVGLRRVAPASLSALARRASERHQPARVREILALIADSATGEEREVEPLSARERLVLAEVLRGFTVAAIAAELYISPNTVKTHLRRLYRKLGVSTREEAIRAARSLGLEQITPPVHPGQPPKRVQTN